MNTEKSSTHSHAARTDERESFMSRAFGYCIENKLLVALITLALAAWGVYVAPFNWDTGSWMRDPVPTDAIPDIGENQQIVFTEWPGRSPQDVDDQVTYPLTTALMGVPGVKTVRSYSMFGFSSIYIIFNEDIDFYWSRSRILEKLSSLPPGTLPKEAQPALGPDATGLGQVFWYTIEGRTPEGEPAGGWDLHELRSVQDWYVRYGLLAAEGVSEVASIGGFVQEYQVDVDPDAMRAYGVSLDEVVRAVQSANLDVGAKSIEVNQVEYLIRGIGFIKSVDDLEKAVIKMNENVPIYVRNVARVGLGPAQRLGVLDKGGAEVVGGVVVVRYGENPLRVIEKVKAQIAEISAGLPKKTLADGTVSQLTIVPFYDRTGLIQETLGTLNTALGQEIIITIIVVLIMVRHLGSSGLISGLLPLSVLLCFIAMKYFRVDANIVALSGIAIAIGTMVDMGIVICENILRKLDEWRARGKRSVNGEPESTDAVILSASKEVASAVMTAIATTIVGFLPVFAMEGPEGKLFRPLAFTKTFCLLAAVIVAIAIIPPLASILFGEKRPWRPLWRYGFHGLLILVGCFVWIEFAWWAGAIVILIALYNAVKPFVPEAYQRGASTAFPWLIAAFAACLLAIDWAPLGSWKGFLPNFLFVGVIVGGVLLLFHFFRRAYPVMLNWALNHKAAFLSIPCVVVLCGLMIWVGFDRVFGWAPNILKNTPVYTAGVHTFPGLGKEFMPALDEGSFLYMPSTMPHASIGEAKDALQKEDQAISALPEVRVAVGKIGRVESALDPAPISMVETIVDYHPQFLQNASGDLLRFKLDPEQTDFFRDPSGAAVNAPDGKPYVVRGKYARDDRGELIPDTGGKPFRLWRPALDPELNPERNGWGGINSPDDIWNEIVRTASVPGSTTAPKLQPIETRLLMLQSGMRAPMGVKIKGPDLATIDQVGLQFEEALREFPLINAATVNADRIVGKPYLEIIIDREAIARYGIMVAEVQKSIEVALGGVQLTTTVEGRERYPVRVRYMRELRDSIETLDKILIPAPNGVQAPLGQLAEIRYVRGPQMIKSEDGFLVGYVTFDKQTGLAEVDVVEQASQFLRNKISSGEITVPAGVSYRFAGAFENQVRAQQKLAVVVPLALFLIFLLLYWQFKSVPNALLVFTGVFVAWAGGFILIWLYNQPWFLNFSIAEINMRELFQIHPINLSVAVWVGFLALFGIATDDGVLFATILGQKFNAAKPESIQAIRETTIAAAQQRIRPALMTSATTILALLPVLSSSGRGSDIMIPMAIPSVGGMLVALLTVFVVPTLYCAIQERGLKRTEATKRT